MFSSLPDYCLALIQEDLAEMKMDPYLDLLNGILGPEKGEEVWLRIQQLMTERAETIRPSLDPFYSHIKVDPDTGEEVEGVIFDEEVAAAILLEEDILFLNSFELKPGPRTAGMDLGETLVLFVNCNDIFAWACGDAENITLPELESLYRAWQADPTWGVAKWCCHKRGQKPQKPVEQAMRDDGSWDDEMQELPENTQDAEVQQLFAEYKQAVEEAEQRNKKMDH